MRRASRTNEVWARSKDLVLGTVVSVGTLGVLVFVAAAGEAEAGTYPPRVQIHQSVQVDGATIRLSDLLPPDAPAELGELAARFVLGESPLPASQRVISKAQIEQKLHEFPSLLAQLELPDRLIVTCRRRRLSSAEIWTAIEDFLAGKGLPAIAPPACSEPGADGSTMPEREAAEPGRQDCAVGGLQLQAPVFVTKPDPGLEVKSMEPDRVRRQLRFLFRTAHEPQVLPFYVTVERLPSEMTWRPEPSKSVRPASAPPVVLVPAGKPAKLVVETATMRLTALVSPLESGVQGQVIRVRNLDTQRVFEAQVVGAGLLSRQVTSEE